MKRENRHVAAGVGPSTPDEPRELVAYDYHLPPERIAQQPVRPRDRARLMVVDGTQAGGPIHHRRVADLPQWLRAGDCLVFNDTRVLPCRLEARRLPTGGRVEVLLLHRRSDGTWDALMRPARNAPRGQVLAFAGGWRAEVTGEGPFGERALRFDEGVPVLELMEQEGQLPVPPYIQGQPQRPDWYQTVYARPPGPEVREAPGGDRGSAEEKRIYGSAAAPTAGLHFTRRLLARLEDRGVRLCFVTLHVGLGTFQPIRTRRIDEHRMHREYRVIAAEAAAGIAATRDAGGRVVAVGTTVVRTLESAANGRGGVAATAGWTDLYVRPGHRFQVVDALLTNFHLPRSSLLVLVAALMGRQRVLTAYREAVAREYRFYSYGDAMLLLPQVQGDRPGRGGTARGR